jgi:hypothetical protein
MSARYEYLFVRLEQSSAMLTGSGVPSAAARESYQDVVHDHAKQGWRLVQIFAPGLAAYGMASYFELIFEKEVVGS